MFGAGSKIKGIGAPVLVLPPGVTPPSPRHDGAEDLSPRPLDYLTKALDDEDLLTALNLKMLYYRDLADLSALLCHLHLPLQGVGSRDSSRVPSVPRKQGGVSIFSPDYDPFDEAANVDPWSPHDPPPPPRFKSVVRFFPNISFPMSSPW